MKNKIALVTGVSRDIGIGAAIARELAQSGIDVFITYYRPYDHESGLAGKAEEPEQLIEELQSMGCGADGLELDLSAANAPQELFDHIEKVFGAVSILVNNATYSMRDGIENLSAEGLDKHYKVNIRAMALLCAEFVKRYKSAFPENNEGRIINLSSGQSVGPMPGELAYVATKGAVEAFTLSVSVEVGRWGITVNAIDPGITDTGWIPKELKEKWSKESPMGRVGKPKDAAKLVRFLASKDAGWITGQVIHSRGGL
jgi:3-oxoacyl-[acyl-carrier protein] reductase